MKKLGLREFNRTHPPVSPLVSGRAAAVWLRSGCLTITLSCLSESIRRQGAWVCEALFSPGPPPRTPLMFGSGEPDSSCWWGWKSQSPSTHPSPTTQFNNLGRKKLPISVVFWIPIRLNKVTVWSQPQVTFSQVSPASSEEWAQLLPPQPPGLS